MTRRHAHASDDTTELSDAAAYVAERKRLRKAGRKVYLPSPAHIQRLAVPFKARQQREGDGPRQEPVERVRVRHAGRRTKKNIET